MAITYVDSTTNGGTSSSASCSAPTGIQTSDVLIAVVHCNNNPSISDNNGGTPFTATLSNQQYNTGSAIYSIFVRVAGASEPGTYNWTLASSQRWSVIISAYRGVNTSDIYNVTPTTTTENSGTGTAVATDAITTTADNAMIVVSGLGDNATFTFTATPGDSFNSRQNNSGEQLSGLADKILGTAGTQSSVSWTGSDAALGWATNIFALNPATFIKDIIAGGIIPFLR